MEMVSGHDGVPGNDDEVEDKASDGGDPIGHLKRECIRRLKTFKDESKIYLYSAIL